MTRKKIPPLPLERGPITHRVLQCAACSRLLAVEICDPPIPEDADEPVIRTREEALEVLAEASPGALWRSAKLCVDRRLKDLLSHPGFEALDHQIRSELHIVVWDHNWDNPGYPITVLNNPEANAYIAGSAFHAYAGDV